MPNKLKSYSTTPSANNATPPDGWPEGMQPSDVNNSAREMMARLREWYQDAEWLNLNHASVCTSGSGDTFILTGNFTSYFTVGRTVKFNESNSQIGIVTGAVFAGAST